MTEGSQPENPAQISSLPAVATSPGHAIETRSFAGEPEENGPSRYQAGSKHCKFHRNFPHTSKCDNCEKRNSSVLQQCDHCGFNICRPCMLKPPEERKDRGRHFASEADLDWRPRDKTITYQKRQKCPQLGSTNFMGKKLRQRVVLPGPTSGIKQDFSKNRLVEELNEIINNDIVTKENTATYPGGSGVICIPAGAHNEHSSRNVIRMAESCSSERPSPAKEPFILCGNKDGSLLPELFSYKGAPPQRPQLKRKLTTAEAEGPGSNPTRRIEPPSVGKPLFNHGSPFTNFNTTKADLDLTDENEPKRQSIDPKNSSFVFPDRPWVVRSRSGLNLNGLTGVQIQILGFLTENYRKPIMLAGYKELLQLELTRVEETLALMRRCTVKTCRRNEPESA